jgi:hypothetical protein
MGRLCCWLFVFDGVGLALSTVSKKFAIFIYLPFVSQGEFFKEGDIVSVTDVGGDIFYAQLRGFLTDEYGEKSGVIRYTTTQGSRQCWRSVTFFVRIRIQLRIRILSSVT